MRDNKGIDFSSYNFKSGFTYAFKLNSFNKQ